ncbi:MAG: hypothetical protein C4318_00820 [Acidimicrobiia bacterium]
MELDATIRWWYEKARAPVGVLHAELSVEVSSPTVTKSCSVPGASTFSYGACPMRYSRISAKASRARVGMRR